MVQKKKAAPEEDALTEEKKGEPKSKMVRKSRTTTKKETQPEAIEPTAEVPVVVEPQPHPGPKENAPRRFDRGALLLGAGLLVLGILLLVSRLLSIPLGGYLWPFFLIIPGAMLFWASLSTESASAEGLSVLGGILSMLGLVLLAQQVTNLWASWAYAWALVAPTSIGISQMVYGSQKGRDSIYRSGQRLARLGLLMFLIGFVFFEVVLGISGFGLGRFGLPVFPMLLIFAGLMVLVGTLARRR